MILEDVTTYLKGYAALTSISGISLFSANKIYPIQVPNGVPMPYLIVEVSEGSRERIAAQMTGGEAMIRITVDGGPNQNVMAGRIVETARRALENFRGLMGGTNDLFLTCSEIRGWAGMAGTYRYQFNVTGRYVETRQVP